MKIDGEEMKKWSDQWLDRQVRKPRLNIGYVKIGGAGREL